jgi:hypothetical protein
MAGSCEHGDEPSGSGATDLVNQLADYEYVSLLGYCTA